MIVLWVRGTSTSKIIIMYVGIFITAVAKWCRRNAESFYAEF